MNKVRDGKVKENKSYCFLPKKKGNDSATVRQLKKEYGSATNGRREYEQLEVYMFGDGILSCVYKIISVCRSNIMFQ